MQTSRPQPAMLEGLSRFLIEHERCGAGFDVAHPAGVGSGRVSITCRGCGARHEYLTNTLEIEREVQFQVQPAPEALTGAAAAPPPAQVAAAPPREAPGDAAATVRQPAFTPGTPPPSPPSSAGPPPSAPPRPSAPTADQPPSPPREPATAEPSGRGITGARAGTLALLAVAVIAVIVALLRLSGGSNNDNAASSAAPAGGNNNPVPQQPSQASQPQQPNQPNQPSDTREVTTPTYTLSVPTDWTVHSGGPALRVSPPNDDDVVLRVYSDKRPDLSLGDMGRLSGQLLLGDHPGGSLSPVHGTKVGGIEAATVGIDFDGGSETAFAIARGADRYLLLVAVSSKASAEERRQMATVVSSFRPA